MKNFIFGVIFILFLLSIALNAFVLYCPIYKSIYIKKNISAVVLEVFPQEASPIIRKEVCEPSI